jgi:tRNA G18 (ribose-2'-O)-methylase SpoU
VRGVQLVPIAEPSDPRVADFRSLTDAGFRRRYETPGPFGGGCFVAEGWLAVERAVRTRQRFRAAMALAPKAQRAAALLDRLDGPLYVVEPEVGAAIAGFDFHRGVLASLERPRPADPEVVLARSSMALAVEGVGDGENLGALFRNAAALGAGAVLVDPGCIDPWSRRVVRTSVGHVMTVPWAWWTGPPARTAHRVVALSPTGGVSLHELPVGPPTLLLVGAEGPGLSGSWLDAADVVARIPMAEGVDSLNVATAAAIALWHLTPRPDPGELAAERSR